MALEIKPTPPIATSVAEVGPTTNINVALVQIVRFPVGWLFTKRAFL
jgi:hypothetical protein